MGYLQANPAARIKLPKPKNTLAQRILTAGQVERILEECRDHPRNHAIVRLLYHAGLRVSELCPLRWGDLVAREGGMGQVLVYGKGEKTRAILLKGDLYDELLALRAGRGDDALLFPLNRSQVFRIVQAAAWAAGIDKAVSPHWMRHAHASHALRKGAPINLGSRYFFGSNIR